MLFEQLINAVKCSSRFSSGDNQPIALGLQNKAIGANLIEINLRSKLSQMGVVAEEYLARPSTLGITQ